MTDGIIIRELASSDWPFVFSTWLRGYRRSDFARSIPSAVYFRIHHEVVERILLRHGVRSLVAHPEGDPDGILGYLISEGQTLHHIYTKQAFRRLGVGRRLLVESGLDPNRLIYTHLFPDADWLKAKYPGATYNPYLL